MYVELKKMISTYIYKDKKTYMYETFNLQTMLDEIVMLVRRELSKDCLPFKPWVFTDEMFRLYPPLIRVV